MTTTPGLATIGYLRYTEVSYREGPMAMGGERQQDDQFYRELPGLEALGETDAAAVGGYQDAMRRMRVLRELADGRKRLHLTQRAVAESMDTTQSAVSELEKGRIDPRLSTLQRYARALGRELDVRVSEAGNTLAEAQPRRGRQALGAPDLGVLTEGSGRDIGLVLKSLLRAQYTQGSRSADRLVEQTGLPESVVDRALSSLSAHEWIREIGDSPQRSPLVALNAERAQVVGISVRRDHVRGVITTLQTDVLLGVDQRPLPSGEPEAVVEVIKSLVDALIDTRGDRRIVLGVGVEIAGLVTDDLGIVLYAPDLEPRSSSWRNFPLGAELQKATGLRTVVENDADVLAVYEYLRRGDTSDIAVVLMSESFEGIGCGLIYNGMLLRGQNGISGEIGHIPVEAAGEQCRFGHQRGCLETVASGAAVVRRAGIKEESENLAEALTEAAHRLRRGDKAAEEAFRAAGHGLGQVLTTLTSILAPALIVIYGQPEFTKESFKSTQVFISAIRETLDEGWFCQGKLKLDIAPRELDPTAGPRGAASVAVSHFLDRPIRWLSAPGTTDDELHEDLLARTL